MSSSALSCGIKRTPALLSLWGSVLFIAHTNHGKSGCCCCFFSLSVLQTKCSLAANSKCLDFVSSPNPGSVGFGNSPYAVPLVFLHPSYLTPLSQTCDAVVNRSTISSTAKSTCVLREPFDRGYTHNRAYSQLKSKAMQTPGHSSIKQNFSASGTISCLTRYSWRVSWNS